MNSEFSVASRNSFHSSTLVPLDKRNLRFRLVFLSKKPERHFDDEETRRMTTRLAIHGAAGRMGKRLVALSTDDVELDLVAALESADSPSLGRDAGELAGIGEIDIHIQTELTEDLDAIIDFSIPTAVDGILDRALSTKTALIIATTGLEEKTIASIEAASNQIPLVVAPSMSMAVNLAMKLCQTAGGSLQQAGGGCDVEIIERHHRFKEDAPSGTALKFGELISEVMGQDRHAHGRSGRPGERLRNEIGYHAVRTGDNPGEHTIVFGMLGETLEISVKASNRDSYALGALAAAKFAHGRDPGLYSMFDVLGLR